MTKKIIVIFMLVHFLGDGLSAQESSNSAKDNNSSEIGNIPNKDSLFYNNGKVASKEIWIISTLSLGTILNVVGSVILIESNKVFYEGAKAQTSKEFGVNLTTEERNNFNDIYTESQSKYNSLKETGFILVGVGSAAILTSIILIADKSIKKNRSLKSGYQIQKTAWNSIPIIPQSHFNLDIDLNSIGFSIR